jgi:hypothetical protein
VGHLRRDFSFEMLFVKSGKLTETYVLGQDGKRLYVTSQLDNSQLSAPLVIRRVYDSAAGNAK